MKGVSLHRWTAAIGLGVAVVLACSSGEGLEPTGSSPDLNVVDLTREFRLRVGERTEVGDEGLAIAFLGVQEDSRCPIDVDCIWAGDAEVVLEVVIGRRAAETIVLHSALEPKVVVHADHGIRLVELEPDPLSTVPIRQRNYVATLSVSRAD